MLCAILLLLRGPFWLIPCFAEIDIWPKTVDYSKAFQSNFFLYQYSSLRRCYEPDICAILLLLRCLFCCYIPCLAEIKIVDFLPKTMDYIVRRFDPTFFYSHNSSLEVAVRLMYSAILLLLRYPFR